MKLSSVSFLIPTYKDERTIESVVRDAVRVGKQAAKQFEIIVINDASPDNTGNVLARLEQSIKELHVITHRINAGYGATIKDLYYAGKSEWLFTVPGDNQIPVEELLTLVPFAGKADMIIGWRVNRNDPPDRLKQSRVYNSLLGTLFGLTLHDVNSVRLMRSSIMNRIRLATSSAFVDAELAIRAEKEGLCVLEIPIDHKARNDEKPGGGGSLRTILPTIFDMVWFWILSN